MSKRKMEFSPQIDFKEQTPTMQIGGVKLDALYENAFHSREENSAGEYARNTTTWD